MFERILTTAIQTAANSFCAVSVVGPRQSGKTTLLKMLFPEHIYLNLEEPDTREKIRLDPKSYFNNENKKWIIDEAQEYPELFSYLLNIIDHNQIKGQFILSGSQNFILLNHISQSLAGRVAILELLPLTYEELKTDGPYAQTAIWDLIYQGSYPGPYHAHINTELWYKSYITTYLQRDIRQLLKIKDLTKFYLFLKLCAGRHGQVLNLSDLGACCGISHTTAAEWLNLLEISYVVFKLPPYYKNFNKRLIKSPKLYFFDSGLVCHLLGIESADHLMLHSARGALFEGYIITELMKHWISRAKTPQFYFWSHHQGFEIDLLIEKSEKLEAIEIKSSATFAKEFLTQLKKWQTLIQSHQKDISKSHLIYAGTESFTVENIQILSYQAITALLNENLI